MPRRSQRYQQQLEARGPDATPIALEEGIRKVQEMAKVGANKGYKGGRKRRGFDQTVELVLHLGIDPKQADQMLRGSIVLPKGIGKTKRVIAFCDEDQAAAAKEAGAVEAGADDLIQKVADGWADFEVAIAHPKLMGKVGKLGRILGPQGKMPSPKSGTVTPDIQTAVKEFSAGKLGYRNDAGGNVRAIVGRVSFPPDDLKENIEAFIDHVRRPPAGLTSSVRVCRPR
jgi:large subunit ribosomal protein L1